MKKKKLDTSSSTGPTKMDTSKRRLEEDLNLLSMIESRIMEIVQIEDECKKKLPKLYYQRLPTFMRRRAACHNLKRLPKKLRPSSAIAFGTKDRKSLLKYRRRVRFQKNKRILVKHARHKYKDPQKSLLHKWFAKRFKMGTKEPLMHVPIHNNAKNQRNLYRQSRSGCAFIALGHLSPIRLTFKPATKGDLNSYQGFLETLNKICREISGFTFLARSLSSGRYEIVIHLFDPNRQSNVHICPGMVNISHRDQDSMSLIIWAPREKLSILTDQLKLISTESGRNFSITQIYPKFWFRIRLVGPSAFREALEIAENKDIHLEAIKDVDNRLNESMGSTIGRHLQEESANFTYYYTVPKTVDVVFKNPQGRLLWHKMIKNKAHLVGGHRDLERLLKEDCFQIKPDYI